MRKKEDGNFEMVSIGPTTSMRMEKFEREFIQQTGVKLIVGKGGMGPETVAGCQEHIAVHAIFPGGCAVLAATLVEEIEESHWQDLSNGSASNSVSSSSRVAAKPDTCAGDVA